VAAPPWWGEAVSGGQAAQEDRAHRDPCNDRPGQEQDYRGLGEGGDDQGQRGQEQAQASHHDRAAGEPGGQELGEGSHREQQKHGGTLDGVVVLESTAPRRW